MYQFKAIPGAHFKHWSLFQYRTPHYKITFSLKYMVINECVPAENVFLQSQVGILAHLDEQCLLPGNVSRFCHNNNTYTRIITYQ